METLQKVSSDYVKKINFPNSTKARFFGPNSRKFPMKRTKVPAAWLWNQFSTPGDRRGGKRGVGSNKKFNGLRSQSGGSILHQAVLTGIFRDRLSKAAQQPFFTHAPSQKRLQDAAVSQRHVIRTPRWNISYLFRDGGKGEPLSTFPSNPPFVTLVSASKCNPLLDIYIHIYLVQSCGIPARGQGRSLIVLLWSQSTPRRDPVNRNSIPFEPIGRLKLISSGYRDTTRVVNRDGIKFDSRPIRIHFAFDIGAFYNITISKRIGPFSTKKLMGLSSFRI